MENKSVEEMREYYRQFDIIMPIFNPKFIAVDLVDSDSGRIESWKYNDSVGAFEFVKVEYIEKPEKSLKGRGFDLLNWENEDLAKLLDCLDESTNPNDFLCFWFKENGEEKSAILRKGNYRDFECAYYIRIGKDVDLFSNKDEVIEFLEYLSKHK